MTKEIIKLNQNTVVAKVHSDEFGGEITEVEKLAEEAGIYGKVKSYKIKKSGNLNSVIFKIV